MLGLDNNLTRKVSASDALLSRARRAWLPGSPISPWHWPFGATLPGATLLAEAMLVGFVGYGVSLVFFVLALRGLGSARTGAYFSTAPFIGAAVAIAAFHEPTSAAFWVAAAFMAGGVWLHLTERHEHEHTHERLAHMLTATCMMPTISMGTRSRGTATNRIRMSTSMCR